MNFRSNSNNYKHLQRLYQSSQLNMTTIFSQCCIFFNQRDKTISPTYQDRCDRFAYMRLYSMHKRECVAVFFTFLLCYGITLFIGIFGPSILSTLQVNGTSLYLVEEHGVNNNADDIYNHIMKGPLIMKTPILSSYSQQLWVIVKIVTRNIDDENVIKKFHLSVVVEGMDAEHKPIVVFDNKNTKNRTRLLTCEKQSCDEFVVVHLGILNYSHYLITLHFFGLEAFHKRYQVAQVFFFFRTFNPAFTQFEVGFRFIFLVATLLITCMFTYRVQKYTVHEWTMEQKWTTLLLFLLIFFNNPFFPLIFFTNSSLPGIMDAVGQINFLCACLLFWLCTYHGLIQTDKKFIQFHLPKIFIVSIIWVPLIILTLWQKRDELEDPTFDFTQDAANYYTVRSFIFIFGAIYVAYLLMLIFKSFMELRSIPFFDLRIKFLTIIIIMVIGIMITMTILHFGVAVLEDQFASSLTTQYSSSVEFMALYGLLNLYIYTMAYIYSPINKSIHEFHMTKESHTFSMVNDSDEEVIYGYDEECRRPLNLLGDDDDSD